MTDSVFSGGPDELILIDSGYHTLTKTAGSYSQEDIVETDLVTQNLLYLYYVDLGDGNLRQSQVLTFDSATNALQKQVLMNIYSGAMRFDYSVFTTALRDVQSQATVYYKIFRVKVR